MKLEILQENLNYALGLISRIIVSKPQLPILSHVFISAKDNKLTLIGSNQETTIVTEIGAKVVQSGEFTLPGRTISEIISSLTAEKISLELEGTTMTIKTGGFRASVNGSPAVDYPSLIPSDLSNVVSWEIGAAEFCSYISRTVFSAATDEGRAVLTGVMFKIDDGSLTLAATDGFRLSVVQAGKVSQKIKSNLVIPAKTLLEVARILSESKIDKTDAAKQKQIKISLLEATNQIIFDLGDTKIYSSLIAGNFPDFEKIIPSKSSYLLTLEASELLKAIKLSSIFARESANIVKFQVQNSKLKISANAPQIGENESEVDVKAEGESEDLPASEAGISIAFNFHYLLDFLSAIGNSGEITIELSSPTAPGVFKIKSDSSFLHLIMPVRVQN